MITAAGLAGLAAQTAPAPTRATAPTMTAPRALRPGRDGRRFKHGDSLLQGMGTGGRPMTAERHGHGKPAGCRAGSRHRARRACGMAGHDGGVAGDLLVDLHALARRHVDQGIEPGQAAERGGQGVDRRVAARQVDALMGQDDRRASPAKRCSKSPGSTIRGRRAPITAGPKPERSAQHRRIASSGSTRPTQRLEEARLAQRPARPGSRPRPTSQSDEHQDRAEIRRLAGSAARSAPLAARRPG
jgi:hypothetical protein